MTVADAARFCADPPKAMVGALIHGEDAAAVADLRRTLLARLLGPDAAAEMRLTTMTGAEARSDPGRIEVELRAGGFFPGPRALAIVGATDGMAPVLAAALADAARPDAFLLATADALPKRSALLKLFEGARTAAALACVPRAQTGPEIAALLSAAGAPAPDADALALLVATAREIGPGAMARLIETLALYRLGEAGPLTAADVAALAGAGDGETEAAVDAVVEGRPAAVRAQLARLAAQGVGPVEICLAAARRFRALHALATQPPGGPRPALWRLSPARRDAAAAHARRWGAARLERALASLLDADAGLRGGQRAPGPALLERALLRLASEVER